MTFNIELVAAIVFAILALSFTFGTLIKEKFHFQ